MYLMVAKIIVNPVGFSKWRVSISIVIIVLFLCQSNRHFLDKKMMYVDSNVKKLF